MLELIDKYFKVTIIRKKKKKVQWAIDFSTELEINFLKRPKERMSQPTNRKFQQRRISNLKFNILELKNTIQS